ncbi:unnamed protein product [Periconia digitata]|uniref:NADP-dependent oxidoreductase domain-containing protein n=1 Tax=Periconia digitata TaxID=1303443 RepID=A0A9W4UJ98_9PLEO|nr:unnamed protein product [Periconia digitata]
MRSAFFAHTTLIFDLHNPTSDHIPGYRSQLSTYRNESIMEFPQFILGASQFGATWTEQQAVELAPTAKDAQITRLDTSPIYPMHNQGASEKYIGAGSYASKGFKIDTKVLFAADGKGHITPEAVEKSITASLERIGVGKLNVFYVHAPDHTTPIATQAAAMDAQHKKGRFAHLGVSNFSIAMLQEWLDVADEKNYVKPTVFQGHYNLLNRTYEKELFPFLKKHGIEFVAYSPLAGGFLTGKLTLAKDEEELKGTRFEVAQTNIPGMIYRNWFDKPSMHDAVRKLAKACEPHGVSVAEASVRWLVFHSSLVGWEGSGVIIGPSRLAQYEMYISSRSQGKLPEDLVGEIEGLWEGVREDAASIVDFGGK